MANMTYFRRNGLAFWIGVQVACAGSGAWAQDPEESEAADDDVVEFEDYQAQGRAEDPLQMMPTEPVESVFGFDKTLLETPRGATSLSADMMENFEIESLNDISTIAPGTFRQSFFGVSGSLDIRGNPGENYFRGVRRLNNPGNFPTPIGASDRVDVVRGPASPIMGPSKIGGYLNFVPKSARVETGQYLEEPTGSIQVTQGKWDKNVLSAEVGGPGEIAGQDFGYYLYGETENSDDYYRNSSTAQNILQGSFNTAFSSKTRVEFGGMYQDFDGNQNAGWNRLTQDLIDNGTYITGLAQPVDSIPGIGNKDGTISRDEFANSPTGQGNPDAGIFTDGPNPFIVGDFTQLTDEDIPEAWALEDPGTTQLDSDEVLIAPEDRLETEITTLYFDLIHDVNRNFSITNKSFYEGMDSINENAYGFSSEINSWVAENKTIFAFDTEHTDWLSASHQVSPSIRHTEFERGQDFSFEFFDRRDLTRPSTARDKRLLGSQNGTDNSDFVFGSTTNYGLAYLGDFTVADRIGLLVGTRYDYIDFDSNRDLSRIDPREFDPETVVVSAGDNDSDVSWTVSLNYQTPWGVTPYVTKSEQSTVISDQGTEVSPDLVRDGDAIATSELDEVGVKADLLNGRLFMAAAWFQQERTNFSAQDLTSNNVTETEGYEFEARWIPMDRLSLTAAFTKLDVYNLTALENGGQFSFLGAEDLDGVSDPSKVFGNQPGGIIPVENKEDARKAGTPEYVYSLTGAYQIGYGLGVTTSVQHVDSVFSGFSKQVRLPAYTLVNAGASYSVGNWKFDGQVRNLTDKDFFRANFPDLFGGTVVKPERPRHWTVSATYSF